MTTRSGLGRSIVLCGDVMTGRGIDQILPHPGDPTLREPLADARSYVTCAEEACGSIPRPADFTWPWGDALPLIDEFTPDVRLINLETTITADGQFARGKTVHYRMHPDNLACLTAIRPDVCTLANNHILDFGPRGLIDTLDALRGAEIACVGAGLDSEHAQRPAILTLSDGHHVVIGAGGTESSGIPRRWAATATRPGVAFIPNLSNRTAADIANRVLALKHPGDTTVVSLHWGSNWGYDVSPSQVRFARRLIDAGVDLVHGHSSHHPRPIEVYRGKLILYGCGDTVNDYEGIKGFEAYRNELRLLYFASIEPDSGNLTTLHMTPLRAHRMRLDHASYPDAEWLRSTLQHISRRFGTCVELDIDADLTVHGS
jgi:poly-gamma-glutamate capsule biosynthesis protein CapA/YwtB (metallophosphatase superfamily)